MNNKNLHSSFYFGLSGLQLPIPKYKQPPPYETASRLTYYSTFFNSIEFNSSFYKLPMANTVTKWYNSVGENFKLTFKFSKQVTHNKGLDFNEAEVERFLTVVANAGDKSGCLLLQFPPSLSAVAFTKLKKLLNCIKKFDAGQLWNVAVEFRNKTWYYEDVYTLLDEYNTALVIHDIPASATPLIESKRDFVYVRFHGPTGNYRDSYPNDFLSEYSVYINEWLRENKTVYVYFNNTMGEAFNNLSSLSNFTRKVLI